MFSKIIFAGLAGPGGHPPVSSPRAGHYAWPRQAVKRLQKIFRPLTSLPLKGRGASLRILERPCKGVSEIFISTIPSLAAAPASQGAPRRVGSHRGGGKIDFSTGAVKEIFKKF